MAERCSGDTASAGVPLLRQPHRDRDSFPSLLVGEAKQGVMYTQAPYLCLQGMGEKVNFLLISCVRCGRAEVQAYRAFQ